MVKKKKYTRPTVVKVKLNPEQAVLGTCSGVAIRNQSGGTYCNQHGQTCKADTGGDSGALS